MTKDKMLLDVRSITEKLFDEDKIDRYVEVLSYDLNLDEYVYDIVRNPTITVYERKDKSIDYYKYIEKISNCVPREVRYDKLQSYLLANMGANVDDFKLAKLIAYSNKHMYNLEFRLETYLRHQWHLNHEPIIPDISCAFIDIEVDLLNSNDISNPMRDPINCVTIINGKTKHCHTYVLKRKFDKSSPYSKLISKQCSVYSKIEKDTSVLINKLHSIFDQNYNGMEYYISFYDDEVNMIQSIFETINTWKVHFLCIWNMDFDIPYIHDRLVRLGHDPAHIVSHPSFNRPYFKYFEDNENDDFAKKNPSCMMSIFPRVVCQMMTYASIRRGEKKLSSYSLDSISSSVLGDTKLKYSQDGLNIRTLAYESPEEFIIYNIKDVLLQYGIDMRTKDMSTLYARSFNSLTPYDDVSKVTQFVRNQKMKDYFDMGYVLSGNFRRHLKTLSNANPKWFNKLSPKSCQITNDTKNTNDEEDTKYAGAFVADPSLNLKVGEKVLGKKTNIVYDYVMDEDLSSMYPSMNIALNIDADTLKFKMTVNKDDVDTNNVMNKLEYDESSNLESCLFEYILTKQYYNLLENWFGAPKLEDLISILDKKYGGNSNE